MEKRVPTYEEGAATGALAERMGVRRAVKEHVALREGPFSMGNERESETKALAEPVGGRG
jgi:hypothetical protein